MGTDLDPKNPAHAAALRHLETDIVGWLTTMAPDGTPQSSVICYLWDGATILTYSEAAAPKMANLAENARVSFHLNSDSHGLHMVTIEGTAALEPTAPPSDQDEGWMSKHLEPYGVWGMDPHETAANWTAAIRITPTRIRVW